MTTRCLSDIDPTDAQRCRGMWGSLGVLPVVILDVYFDDTYKQTLADVVVPSEQITHVGVHPSAIVLNDTAARAWGPGGEQPPYTPDPPA